VTGLAYAVFDTALGSCAVAWGPRGIVGSQLPEADAGRTHDRLRRRFAQAQEALPPPEVRQAIDGIVALLDGQPSDLTEVRLDLDRVAEFDRRVYATALAIRPGHTLSYGEVARRLGDPARARAVGQALARNPFAPIVPCHRVLAAHGQLGGFSAGGGTDTKRRLLLIERARPGDAPDLFDAASAPP